VRLVSVVLGFLLRKVALLAAVVLSLFLGLLLMSALIPALQQAEAERDRLSEVAQERAELAGELEGLRSSYAEAQGRRTEALRAEIETEVGAGRQQVADQESEVDRQRGERDEVCGYPEKLPELLPFGPNPCADAEEVLQKAEEVLATFERTLGEAEEAAAVLGDPTLSNEQKLEQLGEDGELAPAARDIENTESELAQATAEEATLREAQGSWAGRVVNLWARYWKWLAGIAVLVVVMPGVMRVVSYFVLMPLLNRSQKRIRLADGVDDTGATLKTGLAERTLTVELGHGEVLSARSEHVRPVEGKKAHDRLIYDLSAPFVSFAAGLYGLSRVAGDEDGTVAVLATPDDPDSYLMRIDFTDHPGLVMHPRHVVGVIGAPGLRTRWRWGILALARWQVRYIMFAGTGSLIVQGSGEVKADRPRGGSLRIEQHLVMGFDSRLVVGVDRTEVFWPYLWGRTPLVDDEFTGVHPFFWQKASTQGPSNPIARVFGSFFSAFGKLLGF
jgi:hypothetical protein